MSTLRGRLAPDGLPEGDLRRGVKHAHAELRLEPAHLDVQVRLAHAVDHHLVGLFVARDVEGGVLFAEPGEPGRELVLVALRGGGDRVREQGLGELDGRELDRVVLRRPRVPGVRGLELGHRADVAGGYLGDRLVLLPLLGEELTEPFLGVLGRVVDRAVRTDATAEHPEHRDVTDERIGDGLEHERGGGAGRIARTLLRLTAPPDHRDRAAIEW